jgi:UDP-GlcNAc:undecaprenyl-phosphate GlcNAc-1-phosphate transferase
MRGAIPRVGGLGIFVGWFVSLSVLGVATGFAQAADLRITAGSLIPWLLALLPSVGAGLLEDFTQRLSPKFRLGLTSASAVLAVWLLGLTVNRLGFSGLDAYWQMWPACGMLLAFFAIAGLPHAFNLIDGYNGLAGTVAVLICLAIAHVALQVGGPWTGLDGVDTGWCDCRFLALELPAWIDFRR